MNPRPFQTLPTAHCTSEDLERALAGAASPAAAGHLHQCAACAEELRSARTLFAGMRGSAHATAELYRPLSTLATAVGTGRAAGPHAGKPRLGWALAAVALATGVGAPLAVRLGQSNASVGHAALPQPPAGAASPISDDALLKGIQTDLQSSVPASMLPLAGATSTPDATQPTLHK